MPRDRDVALDSPVTGRYKPRPDRFDLQAVWKTPVTRRNSQYSMFATAPAAKAGGAAKAVWWWRCSQGPAGVRA